MSETCWSILYRGPLSSCNYACTYCPFAKTRNSRDELRDDAAKLARFVAWVAGRPESIGVLFTPWGEALQHRAYQQAIIRLSHLPHVRKVSIQTNLSADLEWLRDCRRERVALWTTFHPTQVSRRHFRLQAARLDELGVAHSVGVVGLREHFEEIETLRRELPARTYLWINAYKREPGYYTTGEAERLGRLDPLFPVNNQRHASQGKACRTGATVFSVDGDGTMRRCHFIARTMGNIYAEGFERSLQPSPCTNETCGCHIGYVHLEELDLYATFGEGVLERIPAPVFGLNSRGPETDSGVASSPA